MHDDTVQALCVRIASGAHRFSEECGACREIEAVVTLLRTDRDHWKREAERGAAILTAIRDGLGLQEPMSAAHVLATVVALRKEGEAHAHQGAQ